MVVDQKIVEACAIGVLMVRGFPEEEARAYAATIASRHPDKVLGDMQRELASVFLTLHAHGLMKDGADA